MIQKKDIDSRKALNKALLVMNYDNSKTLNENLNLIFEQKISSVSTPSSGGVAQYADPTYKGRRRGGGFGESDEIPITAKDVSDALLKIRELLFTTGGMVAQVVISILGAEIGAPIAIAALDIAILINDLSIMVNKWEDKPFDSEENWFIYHFSTNVGFKNSVEDIAFLLTGGLLKLLGKTAKGAWEMIKSLFGPKGSFKTWITNGIETLKNLLGKIELIPNNKIKNWTNSKKLEFNKALELLQQGPKKVSKNILKQVPKAVTGGFIVYGFIECVIPILLDDNNDKINSWINSIIDDNEELGLTGKEKYEFPKENCITKTTSPIILINNQKYVFVDVNKGSKLKKI
jgi:hypothetical protein